MVENVISETKNLLIRDLNDEEINKFNTRNLGLYNKNEFSIVLKNINEKIGSIGFSKIEKNVVELRYGIKSDFQAKGYMTEALVAFIEYLWKQNVKKIVIIAKLDNVASNRVAEKNNFKLLKTFSYKDFGMCNYYELEKGGNLNE